MEGNERGDFLDHITEVGIGFLIHVDLAVDLLEHEHGVVELMLLEEVIEGEGNASDLLILSEG